MNLVYGLPQAINERPTTLTIGAFDGVHLGHHKLIARVVEHARHHDHQSALLTFDPHPDYVVHPERARPMLTSVEERAEAIEELGIDLMIVKPFSPEVMQWSAHEFMSRVCQAIALRDLWIGWDFALGRRREGDYARLAEIGQELGFCVYAAERFVLDDMPVSSTMIRTTLASGDVAAAATLLGRPFGVRGPVITGFQRGRTIGFPTANIAVDAHHMLPADGVYVCRAIVNGRRYGAVTNIGMRPTFEGTQRTVEAYLFDFNDMIYGERLHLEFLHRLRGEMKFNGVAELVAQINRDAAAARQWLAGSGRAVER
jgi:riboflavin kinase/FMN adenylyltransferase